LKPNFIFSVFSSIVITWNLIWDLPQSRKILANLSYHTKVIEGISWNFHLSELIFSPLVDMLQTIDGGFGT
jgi:hypothetical protein